MILMSIVMSIVIYLILPLREVRFSKALRERRPRSSKALIHILCDVARHEEIRYKYLTFVMYLLKWLTRVHCDDVD